MNEFIIKSDFIAEKLNYQSIIELIVDRLNTNCDQTCIIDCTLDREWSKKQVLISSLNFANYLIEDLKLAKGEVVCFAANNSDIHAIGLIGVLAAGDVYCSFQEHLPEFEINSVITKTKPSVIICSDKNYELFEELVKINKFIKKLLLIERQNKSQTKYSDLSLEEIFERQPKNSNTVLPVATGLNDVISFVMTSGSTGQPKVILKTNGNYLATVECVQHKEFNEMTPNDTLLGTGLCHISGQRGVFSAINGGTILVINRDDKNPDTIFEIIHKYQITIAFLIPTQLNFLAKNYTKFNKNYLKCLKDVVTGGAQISEVSYNTIMREFNFDKFRNCWGMSEVGWGTQTPISEIKNLKNCLTVGKVVPNIEIKVIDSTGKSLPANEEGEIYLKSRQVTPGYLNNEVETSKLFTSDGFLKSGDIGYYDDNQFFYISGRIKEIIVVDATKVFPSELEEILMTHSDVENAAVIGVKHQIHNEVPFAFVTLLKESTVSEQTLIEYFDSRVNYYKKLRGGLRILDTFPMTSLRKINKTELRKMLEK